jgi:hypothetical protein
MNRSRRTRDLVFAALALSLLGTPLLAQDEPPPEEPSGPRFRLGGEVKAHFRDSKAQEVLDLFPFPPTFRPGNNPDIPIFLRTVSPHPSFEVSTATLRGEGELSSHVSAKVEVHFIDLYNRNPTSSDDRFVVREAWVAFGRKDQPLKTIGEGATFYLQAGLAPRFTKHQLRRLESYGLWGTTVGRLEQPQVEAGGTFARHVYWRAMVGNGNPLFMRDPNALAGDNGTPERQPGTVNPIYESGFPIMYDAKPQDLNPSGRFEWGVGLGARAVSQDRGLDVMGWYFTRKMQEVVRIRGTFYSGDLKMLRGVFFPLPFEGNKKREAGLNVEGRLGGGRLFAQYVDQDIANLPRRGYEAELAWRFSLPGLFLVGESPFGNWIQPAIRVSHIDNRFVTPDVFPAPSFGWDWTKYDLGVRVGLVRDVDLTLEYSRNVATQAGGEKVHPDEFLVTLRAGF